MRIIAAVIIVVVACLPGARLLPVSQCLQRQDADSSAPKRLKLDSGPRCQMFLSEMRLRKTGEEENFPFIELRPICTKRPGKAPKNPLASFKLLIVFGKPLAVQLFVDFENIPYDETKSFIVIGSSRISNVDISLSSPHVQSTFSKTNDNDMLPNPDDSAYSIMILYDVTKGEANSMNLWVTPDGTMLPRILRTETAKLIVSRIVDMVVVGTEDADSINQFSPFWKYNSLQQNQMFLSEWNKIEAATSDNSVNICNDDYKGFDSNSFVSKQDSPGLPNKCKDEETESNDLDDYNPLLTNAYPLLHKISPVQLEEMRSDFDDTRIITCANSFPKGESLLNSADVRKWLRFVEGQEPCKFKCVACSNYYSSGFRPDVKRKSRIVKEGFSSTNIYSNRDIIKSHGENPIHQEAMEFYEQIRASNTIEENTRIIQNFEAHEKEIFNATMNVVLFVYAEMKAGVSFKSHETFMTALRIMGANVGWLQHTGDAAQSITKAISKTLHIKLLQELVAKEQPFSILVDSSTNSNQPFLAVYFQTLQEELPTTHFYSLVPMDEGEKARQMTDSLIAQIKTDSEIVDGFEEFFKSKITSISSDGAAVMVAEKTSFKAFLIEYIGRKIPNIVCLAHNLDRAYKIGIQQDKNLIKDLDPYFDEEKLWQLTYFEKFDKTTNELYTFYSSRGYKKWQHFLQTAQDLDFRTKRLKYVYDIRWSDSHYRSLESIHHNYYPLVEDLDQIIADKDFDKTSQNTALRIYQRMTDKTYLLVLHEFLDILNTFKIASKLFQESSSIVVGKIGIVYDILKSLQAYKQAPGSWLQDFLSNVLCFGTCDGGSCTLEMYDSCEHTVIRGMKIEHQYPVVLSYSEVRRITYTNMISSVKKYFKLDLLESFELFNPKLLSFSNEESDSQIEVNSDFMLEKFYQTDDINGQFHVFQNFKDRATFICKFYDLKQDKCKTFTADWRNILKCVVTNDELKGKCDKDATTFWPAAFRHCSDVWTTLARDLVTSVLVTSYSSSECERGFSIMNNIKTKTRSRLEKSTLDSIMKVKINGPDLKDFNTYEFTIEFLKSFVRVDDLEFKNSKGPNNGIVGIGTAASHSL